MTEKFNIMVVDDEVLLREGLRAMLEREPFTGYVYEAENLDDFLLNLKKFHIDFVLLDIRLKSTSGFELLRALSTLPYKPHIIGLTGLDGTEVVIHLLKAGVQSVVYKLDGYSEIVNAIKNVQTRGTYFSQGILRIIESNAGRWDEIPTVTLTESEMNMLRAIARGETTKEIAIEYKMSPATAETYRIRLLRKVGVPNTAALLAYAYRNGIL